MANYTEYLKIVNAISPVFDFDYHKDPTLAENGIYDYLQNLFLDYYGDREINAETYEGFRKKLKVNYRLAIDRFTPLYKNIPTDVISPDYFSVEANEIFTSDVIAESSGTAQSLSNVINQGLPITKYTPLTKDYASDKQDAEIDSSNTQTGTTHTNNVTKKLKSADEIDLVNKAINDLRNLDEIFITNYLFKELFLSIY